MLGNVSPGIAAGYEVLSHFNRFDSTTNCLKAYRRGAIIAPPEAAEMAIRPRNARVSPLESLLRAGLIRPLPVNYSETKAEPMAGRAEGAGDPAGEQAPSTTPSPGETGDGSAPETSAEDSEGLQKETKKSKR